MLTIILLIQTIFSQLENRSWTPLELYEYSYQPNNDLNFYSPNSLSKKKTEDLVIKLSKLFPEINLKVFLINSINPIEYWNSEENIPDINKFLKEFIIIIKKEEENKEKNLFCVYSLDDKIKICEKDEEISKRNFKIIKKRLNYIIGTPFVSNEDIERNKLIHHSSFFLYSLIIFCFFLVTCVSCCINCRSSSEFEKNEKEDPSLSTITTSSDKGSVELREIYNSQKKQDILTNSFNLFSRKI